MPGTLISFQKFPTFGFAHHLFTEETRQLQNDIQHSFVLVYVKSGHLTAHIYGRDFDAPAGSLLILFRDFPFSLTSEANMPQDYCSIQVYTDFTFQFLDDHEDFPAGFDGLALPIVIPPCNEVESIKKDMFTIVANLSISRETYKTSAAMTLCGILSRLDAIYRQKQHKGKNISTYWEYKIKRYLADHIDKTITLEDLATAMGKTPNYLNSVFTQVAGIGIHQYQNREKMRLAAMLMESQNLSFREACENVGIADLSHGYRLFKKHMGVTPKAFMASEHTEYK